PRNSEARHVVFYALPRSARGGGRGGRTVGDEQTDDAVALVHDEDLALRPHPESQVGAQRLRLPLRLVLLLNQLQQRLLRALVVQHDAADARLPAVRRQLVGIEIEDFAAGIVAEDEQVLELANRRAAVDVDARHGGAVQREQRILVVELGDWP